MRDGRMRNDAWSYRRRSDDRLELFTGPIVGEFIAPSPSAGSLPMCSVTLGMCSRSADKGDALSLEPEALRAGRLRNRRGSGFLWRMSPAQREIGCRTSSLLRQLCAMADICSTTIFLQPTR